MYWIAQDGELQAQLSELRARYQGLRIHRLAMAALQRGGQRLAAAGVMNSSGMPHDCSDLAGRLMREVLVRAQTAC